MNVESAKFAVGNEQTIRLTCSVGFSSWPFFKREPDALGWQEVLGIADRCLYLAKNSGRNSWVGVTVRSDYKGKAEPEALDDLQAAEAKGILRIQSSDSAESGKPQYQSSSKQTTGSEAFH